MFSDYLLSPFQVITGHNVLFRVRCGANISAVISAACLNLYQILELNFFEKIFLQNTCAAMDNQHLRAMYNVEEGQVEVN